MPTGRIKYYNLDKGFGFIAQDSSEEDVFLHSSAIMYAECDELRVGQRVKYNIVEGDKGLVAKNVEVLLTPTEKRWLRQGKTIIPRGYSGFPSQNQERYYDEDESISTETEDDNTNTDDKYTQEDWKKQYNKDRSTIQNETGIEEKEHTSRQLSFGDLYILKQINYETPMFFALYDHVKFPAIVLEMTLTGLTLNTNGQEKVVPKTDVKYCYKEVDAEKVIELLQFNEEVKKKQLKPVKSQNDVYLIHPDSIQQGRQDGNSIVIMLREGEIFQGTVDWISPYEIKMVLKNGSKVVVFRHAICEFSVIKGEV